MSKSMDNPTTSIPGRSRSQQWLHGLRPLLWWGILVLMLYGVRLHQQLIRQTRLTYAVTLQGKPVDYQALVRLDGQPTFTGARVPLGWHTLSISHPKSESYSTNLFIWYGENQLGDVALNRLKGTLAIQADPPAALLSIRGPEFTLTLTNSFGTVEFVPTDQYVVEARYHHWQGRQEILVTHNATANYTFAPQIGVLQMTCNQLNTSFELYGPDNSLIEHGVLPSMIDGLPIGKYTVIAFNQVNRQEKVVTVSSGTVKKIDMSFL